MDEVLVLGPNDLDEEFRQRSRDILQQEHGVGLWIWKHYVEYLAMSKVNDGQHTLTEGITTSAIKQFLVFC